MPGLPLVTSREPVGTAIPPSWIGLVRMCSPILLLTPPGKAKDVLSVVDTVLIMTVNPGFYGSPFLPDCMKKIEMVRSICPDARIGIDGGINELTITRALSFPLDFICVGSAIFRDRNPAKMFRSLQEKAGQP